MTVELMPPPISSDVMPKQGSRIECVHSVGAASAAGSWPLNDSRLRWYSYARVAWWHLLKALGAGAGDNVLLPDLICDVMVEPLAELGVEPRYYRSNPLVSVPAEELARRCDRRTRAVLLVHYFGLPQPMDEAIAFCRFEGIPLVEDVSQGFLSATADGSSLGGGGDVSLFSFRKTIPLPHGAGLMAHDPQIAAALDRTSIHLAQPRRDVWRFWGKRLDRRCFNGRLEWMLDCVRHHFSISRGDHDGASDAEFNPDPFVNCLVCPSRQVPWLMSRFDLEAERQRRRAAFLALLARWSREHLPGKPLLHSLPAGCVPYAFPVLPATGESVEDLATCLRTLGLSADIWPRLPAQLPNAITHRRHALLWL